MVDATEEAVLDSLLTAPTTVGRDGNTSEGLDPEAVGRCCRRPIVPGTERDVVITMADGTGLAATLYLPDRPPDRSRACSRPSPTARTT